MTARRWALPSPARQVASLAAITIPSFANIGGKADIVADPQLNEKAGIAKVEHSTPKPAVTLSPATAEAGSLITVSGANFAGFISVREIMIDRAVVTPVPTPNTDAQGAFTATNVRVPQLDPGRYAVKVDAGVPITAFFTAFFEVVEAVAALAPYRPRRTVHAPWATDWSECGTWTAPLRPGASTIPIPKSPPSTP